MNLSRGNEVLGLKLQVSTFAFGSLAMKAFPTIVRATGNLILLFTLNITILLFIPKPQLKKDLSCLDFTLLLFLLY